MVQSRAILLTGSTGFIGGDLLRSLFERDSEVRVYCLIRAKTRELLEARRRALLAHIGVDGPDAARVIAVAGELIQEDLGLGDAFAAIARDVDEIYHVAASTKFDLALEDARAINRDGAAHVLAFARAAQDAGGLRRLHHVSTAYVVGRREGVLTEDDALSPDFRNTYEQTKWESEQLLNPERAGVPVTCYRPSIVVGNSSTGATLHFRVLYDPMRWIYGGKMDVLPCRPGVRLDVVPVDYVCDAVIAIGSRADSEGGVYHLTSGPEGAMSIREIVDVAVDVVNRYHGEIGKDPIAPPTIASPDAPPSKNAEERARLEKLFQLGETVMGSHVPYMVSEQLFDTTRTRRALSDTEIVCPPLPSYLPRIVRWGVERRFENR